MRSSLTHFSCARCGALARLARDHPGGGLTFRAWSAPSAARLRSQRNRAGQSHRLPLGEATSRVASRSARHQSASAPDPLGGSQTGSTLYSRHAPLGLHRRASRRVLRGWLRLHRPLPPAGPDREIAHGTGRFARRRARFAGPANDQDGRVVGTGAVGSDLIDRTSIRRRGPVRRIAGVAGAILIMASVAAWVGLRDTRTVAAAPSDTVKILIGAAATLDPAAQGDIGSAAISAQLFEGLTAFDPQLKVRPALAESWDLLDGGRRIVFHLRPNLTFSDGSPITGEDVVRSWLRIMDPQAPSPLLSLIGDVDGALAYAHGQNPDPASVGLKADGLDVEVRLTRPAADFVSVVASPTFAVVPPGVGTDPRALEPARLRRQRRLHPPVDRRHEDRDRRQRPLLGRQAGDPDDPARPRHRRAEPGPGVRGRRRRPDQRLPVRRHVDRLRRRAGAAAPAGCVALDELLRLRHDEAAVRRRPGSPGLREGRRLAAARVARRRPDRDRRHRHGPDRASRAAATRTSCPTTTQTERASSSPRPAIPAARASPRRRS